MIKALTPSDLDTVVRLGPYWADQWSVDDFDEEHWREAVRHYSIYVDRCWLNLFNNNNQLVGFIGGIISKIPHNQTIISQIHYWYVKDEFLENYNLVEMHSAFVDWARSLQSRAIMGPGFAKPPEAYAQFFQDQAYEYTDPTPVKGMI
jgi:hypothetical protein